MGKEFVYVILGGGVAAGYAALEFTRRGLGLGELCIISEEHVAPYERPALSKGFLSPEAPTRLPTFHTCVGANEEKLTPEWYERHGIELLLGTHVSSSDLRQKVLHTDSGETISYKILIIATGAQALKLPEIGVKGPDAENICYLRNLDDAAKLVNSMKTCSGGNAVVIGGGYIGMECAAALVINHVKVTMVFPSKHCMDRLFTPVIAGLYEKYYESRGVKFIKQNAVTSYENNSRGKVRAVILRDGKRVPTDMVVVGVGARANTSLFAGQLELEKGGIKVNGRMRTSSRSVYAVGDVSAFPVKLFGGDLHRFEHVDCARKTAKHAVAAIMDPWRTGKIDYLPFFYSKVFTLSWQFYGDNRGEVVHYGDFAAGMRFGAYWVDKGRLVGAFLEGGGRHENEAVAEAIRMKLAVKDLTELQQSGVEFALQACRRASTTPYGAGRMVSYAVAAGALLAVMVAVFAYWYDHVQ